MPLESGSLFQERYEIIACLNSGGMGAVYHARDTRLKNSSCAIKEMLPGDEHEDYFREKFEAEMEALSRLNHPDIPRVRDYFQVGGTRYLVMDFIAGHNLQEELDQTLEVTGQPCDPASVVADALVILNILTYLHGQNPPLIHRDIKPANLIREASSGRVKLVDFGLIKEARPDARSMTMVGTIGYCAPEQLVGRAEVRSDLYSLGATIQHLLTGVAPGMRLARPQGDFKPGLVEIIERATAVAAADRFANAREMAVILENWLRSESGLEAAQVAPAPVAAPAPAAPPAGSPAPSFTRENLNTYSRRVLDGFVATVADPVNWASLGAGIGLALALQLLVKMTLAAQGGLAFLMALLTLGVFLPLFGFFLTALRERAAGVPQLPRWDRFLPLAGSGLRGLAMVLLYPWTLVVVLSLTYLIGSMLIKYQATDLRLLLFPVIVVLNIATLFLLVRLGWNLPWALMLLSETESVVTGLDYASAPMRSPSAPRAITFLFGGLVLLLLSLASSLLGASLLRFVVLPPLTFLALLFACHVAGTLRAEMSDLAPHRGLVSLALERVSTR